MINQEELIAKAKKVKGKIDHIYIHHTAGTYKMNDLEKSHYHITNDTLGCCLWICLFF